MQTIGINSNPKSSQNGAVPEARRGNSASRFQEILAASSSRAEPSSAVPFEDSPTEPETATLSTLETSPQNPNAHSTDPQDEDHEPTTSADDSIHVAINGASPPPADSHPRAGGKTQETAPSSSSDLEETKATPPIGERNPQPPSAEELRNRETSRESFDGDGTSSKSPSREVEPDAALEEKTTSRISKDANEESESSVEKDAKGDEETETDEEAGSHRDRDREREQDREQEREQARERDRGALKLDLSARDAKDQLSKPPSPPSTSETQPPPAAAAPNANGAVEPPAGRPAEAQNTAPAPRAQVVTAFDPIDPTRQIVMKITPELQQARISLYPKELGEVRVHLDLTKEGLIANLGAETKSAVALLESRLQELQLGLSDKGIQVSSVRVFLHEDMPDQSDPKPKKERGQNEAQDHEPDSKFKHFTAQYRAPITSLRGLDIRI